MPERGVTRRAALVGALTGVSRVLGLVREMLTARLFGTALVQSAFVVAFQIPNLFRRLFGEGALAAAFVPAFARSQREESPAAALTLARRVMTLLGLLLAGFVALGIVGTYALAPRVAAGGRVAATLPLLRIMLPYAVFICLAATATGMLNVLGDFRRPALAPALLNILWIAVLVGVCPWISDDMQVRIRAVAWGIVLAGVVQLGYLWRALRRRGWTVLPQRGGLADARVRTVWRQTLPAAIGAGVVQINVCLDAVLAMWAADWAPSALTYADRVLYLPMGLVATAFGTVLLPTFARQCAEADFASVRATLRDALSDLLLVMIPAAVGLAVLAPQIVALLYERGAFGAQDTVRTARALACYAPGLVAFSVHKVLNPLFYGLHDTRTPMRVAIGAVLLNFTLNVLFVLTWPVEWKHAGIAVSTVLSSAVASCVLARLARRRLGSLGWSPVFGLAARALLAASAMGAVAHGTVRWGTARCAAALTDAGLARATVVVAAIAAGGATYGLAMAMLCPREFRRLAAFARRGLSRRRRS